MLSLRIAARFLRRSRLQSVFIVLGIAVGIGVQVFVGSLIISLQKTLLDETIGSSPHVTVSGTDGEPVSYGSELRQAVTSDPRVTAAAPVRRLSALVPKGKASLPLSLTGGELKQIDSIYDVSGRIVAGEARLTGNDVIVGVDFADAAGVAPGDAMALVLPNGSRERMTVSGVVDLGAAVANQRSGFVSDSFSADALRMAPLQFSEVVAQLADPFDSTAVVDEWTADPAFAGLTVTEWQAGNSDLLQGLQAQSSSSYMIQVFVIVAVALGIASTLAISAVQKTRQIGILKAMGLSDGRAGLVFAWEALLLGVTGATLGVVTGVALIALLNAVGSALTITVQPVFALISFCIGIAVALVSAIAPIRRTSRVDAIEVIQNG